MTTNVYDDIILMDYDFWEWLCRILGIPNN